MKTTQLISMIALGAILGLQSCSEHGNKETASPPAAKGIMLGEHSLKADVAASTITWKGNMTGLKTYSHNGLISLKEGSVQLKDGRITGGNFIIDMTSIKPTDDGYTAENTAEDLVMHLSTPDFFDVATHPTASFKITSISGNTGKGLLTVRGVQGEEEIKDITITEKGDLAEIKGNITFDRQKYGAAYKAAKDMLLADDIEIGVNLVVKK